MITAVRFAWTAVSGYKTYAILGVGFVFVIAKGVFGVEVPGIQVDENTWLQDTLALAAGGTMRHAITSRR